MPSAEQTIDDVAAATDFSGAVRVDADGAIVFAKAYGSADRGHDVANEIDTRFAVASLSKGLTALVVVSLVDDGTLTLDTAARSVLGDDLPLIADDVTVEHLLAHRSGIGDYLDEDAADDVTDHIVPGSMHELVAIEDFLAVLGGHPTVFPAGERFAYNNGGFVVLGLIAERASGIDYRDLVRTRVTEPAGMHDTGFLRTDELPGDAALNYLWTDRPRTNIFHLPVLGSPDGGAYTTVADLAAFWPALFDGRIVPVERVAEMVHPRSDWPEESRRYGLGFHLHETTDTVWLEGYDAGVSCTSTLVPATSTIYTVVSNTSEGAWPVLERLDALYDA
jgi:CubicO group peptidase (beta-lactamase class C family)